ncbi:MAG: MBL fold metallo-hydrolase [Bacteroidia bacterium]
MKVTFLGTGTSQGVPVIACECEVCRSSDSRDNRLRCSVLISDTQGNLLIDTGPDFRQQILRENIKHLDAVLFTHEHKDHIAGLDDIRAFNYFQRKHMDIYLSEHVETALRREFAYIFAKNKYPGIPLINLHRINLNPFKLLGHQITPIEVSHYLMPVFGFKIDSFCYVTDAKSIAESELTKMKNAKVLVLNALRKETHVSHFTLKEALEVIDYVKPEKAYLTHLSHQMGLHAEVEKELPKNVFLAYDGLKIDI